MEQFLDAKQVAAILNIEVDSLSRQRRDGRGPTYHKFGSLVRYAKSDVEQYIAERKVVPRRRG